MRSLGNLRLYRNSDITSKSIWRNQQHIKRKTRKSRTQIAISASHTVTVWKSFTPTKFSRWVKDRYLLTWDATTAQYRMSSLHSNRQAVPTKNNTWISITYRGSRQFRSKTSLTKKKVVGEEKSCRQTQQFLVTILVRSNSQVSEGAQSALWNSFSALMTMRSIAVKVILLKDA